MLLQIEAPETIQLVEELERRTGQSAERIVAAALREHLARLRTPEEEEERRARLDALIANLSARLPEPYRSLDHGDWLYGEDSLPK